MTPLRVRDGRTLSILTARGGELTIDLHPGIYWTYEGHFIKAIYNDTYESSD